MKEDYLLTGPLEETNRPYAIAKISGIEMCRSYNKQYGTCFFAAMPTNLYGLNDNYDRRNSHVIPALIRKMHDAKVSGADTVELWGTGTPRREFLFSDDAADACLFLMNLPREQLNKNLLDERRPPIINVGLGQDITVRELAELIADVVSYEGRLTFDSAMPDGTARKLLDTSRLNDLGWKPKISLRDGLEKAYLEFSARAQTLDAAQASTAPLSGWCE
jgi:GDP-L-fucose synthase